MKLIKINFFLMVGVTFSTNMVLASEISLYRECSGALSCDGGENESVPSDSTDLDENNKDSEDTDTDAVQQDSSAIRSEVDGLTSQAIGAAAVAGEDAKLAADSADTQAAAADSANKASEAQASGNGNSGDATDCPVELYSGCKITREVDFEHVLFPLIRQHRLSQGSAWSLGVGWHSAIDSRILWGTAIDNQPQQQAYELAAQQYVAIIAQIESAIANLRSQFVNRVGYSPDIAGYIETQIETLNALQASYVAQSENATQQLESLREINNRSDEYKLRNRYSADPNFAKEYEIGIGKIKWITPQGSRQLFSFDSASLKASALQGNSAQLEVSLANGAIVTTAVGVRYHFNVYGLLVRIEGNDGRWVEIERDSAQQAIAIVDELGRYLALEYSDGRLVGITDQVGRITHFSYQNQKLIEVVQFDGQRQSYEYNYETNPLAITRKSDGKGNSSVYTYRELDGTSVVDVQIDPDGNRFDYEYDFPNRMTTVINRNGTRTRYQYDSNNNIISKVFEADGSEIDYLYDEQGNRVAEYNELGEQTLYEYDQFNRLLSTTDASGRTTSLQRDSDGRIVTSTNNASESTHIEYDLQGKVQTITQADGSTIEEFWQNGVLVKRTDPVGSQTLFEYDELGYPTRIEQFDANTQSGGEALTLLEHDAIGRITRVSQGAGSLADEEWRTTYYEYSTTDGRSLNQPTRITDPLGRQSVFNYDVTGQLTYQKDFSGVESFYTYTAGGRVSTKQVKVPHDEKNRQYLTQYFYDAENNLTKTIQANGAIWHYQYDARNRLIHTYIEGTQVSKRFSYDATGRQLSELDSSGNITLSQHYSDGQLQSMTNALGNVSTYSYDNAGRLSAVFDDERGDYTQQYLRNELGFITQVVDANQNYTDYVVDSLGQSIAVSVPNSNQERIRLQLDWRGNPITQSDAGSGELRYQYTVFGQVSQIVDSEGGIESFEYDAIGRKVSHLNKAGLKTQWHYDQQPTKLIVTQTETDTQQSIVFLNNLRTSTKTYDLLGRLIAYSDSMDHGWSITLNAIGLVSGIVNPDGGRITREYSLAGQMTSETTHSAEGDSRTSYYTYDGEGRVITEQLAHYAFGSVNSYQYNALGLVESVTMPDGGSYSYQYDSAGRLMASYNPLGYVESWQYDGNDNPVNYTDSEGFAWQYGYDADNQVVRVIDPQSTGSGITEYQYDEMSRLVAVKDPLARVTVQHRNSLGRVIATYDAQGNSVNYQLDSAGRALRVTNRLNQTTVQQFDAFGNRISLTTPQGNTTQFEYDALNRPIAQIDAHNEYQQWTYNYRDQIHSYTDQLSRTTQYQYSGFGNLVSVEQANGAQTRYQYNTADKLTQVVNPLGESQSFEYDVMSRLSSFTNEVGQQWHYEYDQAGQLTQNNQPQSLTNISYQYDKRGNLTERQHWQNGQLISESLSYDELGRLSGIHSPALSEQYQYDNASQLIQVNNDTLGQTFNYGYDNLGNRVASQLTSGDSVYYTRDAEGQVIAMQREGAQGTFNFTVNYDSNGRITQIDYPNHSRRSLEYDELERIVGITIEQEQYKGKRWSGSWQAIEVLSYQYDATGNVTAYNRQTELGAKEQWAYFEYDQVNRLLSADYPSNDDIDYRWDAAGNLIEKQTKSHTFSYRYNQANQLTQMYGHRLPGFSCSDSNCDDDEQGSSQHTYNYQYDANGNLASVDDGNETQHYQHDALGRLTSVVNPNGSATNYAYDSRSRRVVTEHSSDGEVTALVSHYDGRQEIGQWQQTANGFANFRSLTALPIPGLPYAEVLHQTLSDVNSALVKATGTKGADISNLFIHHDRLGSAIQVLDAQGTSAMRLGYSPFGQVYRRHNDQTFWKINAGVNANKQLAQLMPYQYTGRYTDGNTGLVNLDSRWYNPHISRFVQPDQWNFKNTYLPQEIQHELMRYTGLNTNQLLRDPSQQMSYGYVSGNPLSWVDPFGLCMPEYYRIEPANSYMSGGALVEVYTNGTVTHNGVDAYKATLRAKGTGFTQGDIEGFSDAMNILSTGALFSGQVHVAVVAGALSAVSGYVAAAIDDDPKKAISQEILANVTARKTLKTIEMIGKGSKILPEDSNMVDGTFEYLSREITGLFDEIEDGKNK
ncbi:RHS repeat-associated core domain-containing protein [Vibrio gallicus]|uniref:RHS repeat-associated core domain-containing protein n=1 Tax=Vibrio gallicus TaxID=190897 RepID=UPI0021C4770B|nr:RHS repeat-associated core domain-containing protein [Vibrio gallicus]